MMNHDSKRPVTLEDILRLKRAERPPAEFWTQFDRELRAKQLAALVEKRPWWRTISLAPMFAGMRRFHLPLGAGAVLAVTIFSVRGYHGSSPSAVPAPAVATMAAPQSHANAAAADALAANVTTVAVAATSESIPAASGAPAVAAAEPAASARFVLSSDATPSGGLVQMIPLVGAPSPADDYAPTVAPGTRLVAENFAAIQTSETRLSQQFLSPERGFETRALPAKARPIEPLAQMKVPSGSRRAYLIASATLASTTTPVLTSDRSARGLSDERLYDQISRVNARGAGVLVKF